MEKKTEKEEKYMKELQDRYIRFDWAIKRLLRQKANFGVLEGFLTVFLGEQIKIEEILEAIRSNTKAIRFDLGQRIRLQVRKIPELSFFIDDSLDYIENIDNLLHK